jgi:glycosyltransferase involved in cell wall biosynthesis
MSAIGLLKGSSSPDRPGCGGEKNEFLGNAYALLFPIDWPAPFGLVMIEAMACGTPVIAYRQGSVPEVMEEGVTGFLVHSMEDAVRAAERIPSLSRQRCRQLFAERFSASRMARDDLAFYQRLVDRKAAVAAVSLEVASVAAEVAVVT